MKHMNHYGPWALVAGAAEGIGWAFSEQLAGMGLNLVMVDHNSDALLNAAGRIRETYSVEVLELHVDLADEKLVDLLRDKAGHLEINLLVYNAAQSFPGPFLKQSPDNYRKVIATNCTGPVMLTHYLGSLMAGRGKGGIILMSSMAALQGSPWLSVYGSSKAFNLVLGESLHAELKTRGVDVTVCLPGATRTPAYLSSKPGDTGPTSLEMEPGDVARAALGALGKKPVVVAGTKNRFFSFIMSRILSRKIALSIMASQTGKMFND